MPASISHYRRIVLLLWLAAAVLLGLTWWHVFSLVNDSHTRELANARRDLANLTRVSQEHADRTFRGADQVIRFIQSRYLELGDQLDLTALTTQGVIDVEIFPQVGVINAKGIYVLANRPITSNIDLSDREHFKVHVTTPSDALFVSQPVLGRATGKWSIQLTRRISRPNGDFAGVVVVSVDPGYFTRFYKELKLGDQGLMALYGLDGVARARSVGTREEFGSEAKSSRVFARIAAGEQEGQFTAHSPVDKVERMVHFRKLPGHSLVVAAGLDTKTVLANHNTAKRALWLQAAIVSLLVLALATALTRHLRQIRSEMRLREREQHQTEELNAQLNAIFDLSPDGFVSFDAKKRVNYISPAFKKLTGMGKEALEGVDENDFSIWLSWRCSASTPFLGVAALRTAVNRGRPDQRVLIELNQDSKRVLQLGLRSSQSTSVSQILHLRDVTHEAEVDQMKSEFLATAAHELRTPMASIFGYAEVLLNDKFDEATQHEFLNTIYVQSKLMTNILNELLDLARIEARRDKDFRYTRVDLQLLVTDLARTYPVPNGRRGLELTLPEHPLYLMADAGKLRQTLLNVVSNAFKYSPNGGPVVLKAWVRNTAAQAPGVCIEVTDRGIGMNAAQRARVGERFYRADPSGRIPGTGLGMSIVKEIITLHHGTLEIDSAPGAGTTVRLCLPTYTTLQDSFDAAGPSRSELDDTVQDTRPVVLD
ncbi:MAG: ATP-binding protein [Rhodoferax sp.]|uniref:sensor histidine kinase n=1 Tax=Rhodoferax sp. TaxID=50421 RepID=UPI002731D133|nr:ATP-binding protein [Rhodoferax sp.]MDP1529112.1 ATP-binding protein [Rhodoferax sp.]MDP1945496.1 ATP-binding protein [Rhodoferax sp.]